MTAIHLYNTMSRQKEMFKPLKAGQVGFYSCGPTVYHDAHIGNLRSFIFADLLKRMFRYAGYHVQHVINITDVGHLTSDSDIGEDKLEKGAAREHKSVWQIAEFYTEAFQRDLALLNIIPPNTWCKATDHIKEQIAQIQEIEKNGFSYVIADGVYFDTAKLKDYGKLVRLNIDELQAGARIEVVAGKRNVTDFALWKLTAPGVKRLMEWDSPWGRGAPGWHIECSSMSMKYLGDEFDIHTGGIDLATVHHTNEIAQAEAAGKKFARYWLHNEFLVMKNNEKMAKSTGNFITLATAQEHGFSPLDYRYFCLTAHYRKYLQFSWEALQGAADAYKSLKNKIYVNKDATAIGDQAVKHNYQQAFLDAITDDLNMPQALAVLWDVLSDDLLGAKDKYDLALVFDTVFGLGLEQVGDDHVPEEVQLLVAEREQCRKRKEWKQSDDLRIRIADLGYDVQDTAKGPVVRPK